MQNINSIEKLRRHLRTIESFDEVDGTVDSGAAYCVFPTSLVQ